jgi:hypothetical protein
MVASLGQDEDVFVLSAFSTNRGSWMIPLCRVTPLLLTPVVTVRRHWRRQPQGHSAALHKSISSQTSNIDEH